MKSQLVTERVFRALAHYGEAASRQELATKAECALPTVTVALHVLRQTGCITESGDAGDRRISVTEKGRRCLAGEIKMPSHRDIRGRPEMSFSGEEKRRRCLKCRSEFNSGGKGNQICDACKSTAEWKAGPNEAFALVGRGL